MRNQLPSLLFCALLLLCATLAHASSPLTTPGKNEVVLDSAEIKALLLLKENLANLQDPEKHREFSLAYASGAQHYCDHCENPKHVDIATYIGAFPQGLTFKYDIDQSKITSVMEDLGEYTVVIPFRKQVPKVKDGQVVHLSAKWVDLVAYITLNYNTGSFKITDVKLDRAPAANVLMLEASPLLGLGSLKFADEASVLKSKSSGASIGLMYYFNPFAGTNQQNIWLKAGLRAGVRRTTLTGNGLVYQRLNEELLATGANPAFPMRENIDVTTTINNIEETVMSTIVEIPIGVSKRWVLSKEKEFSLELELGYGREIGRQVERSYFIDQTGTDHRIFYDGGPTEGVLMLQGDGNGSARVYNKPAEAVESTRDGRIDFFTGQEGKLEKSKSNSRSYMLVGINPSLFLRRVASDRIRWNLGLRLALQGTNRTDNELGRTDFVAGVDKGDEAISSRTASNLQGYIGFFVGLNLK